MVVDIVLVRCRVPLAPLTGELALLDRSESDAADAGALRLLLPRRRCKSLERLAGLAVGLRSVPFRSKLANVPLEETDASELFLP